MSVAEQQRGVFSRAAAVWLVLVGVLSFVGLLILTAYAPQMRGGSDGGPHARHRRAAERRRDRAAGGDLPGHLLAR